MPAYNAAATLQAALEGLAAQTLPAGRFEVIVADDSSQDATPEILAGYRGPLKLVCLRQPQNRGASAARNLAASRAGGDLLVFIDADCVAEVGWLAAHLAAHRDNPGGVGIAGRVIWSREFRGGPLAEYYKELYFPGPPAGEEAGRPEVPFTFFVTSNLSLPRAIFEKLGGFDEDFRYLWDDTVLGYRLSQAGYKLLFDRQAVVFHHRPLLPAEAIARFRRQGQEGMRLLAKYPELAGVAVDPGEILADRYHQEELYNLLARYALGLGYAEGAGRYFETAELEELLARPEFASNFATWRDRRLELYRAELAGLKDDRARLRAYVAHLEAAYRREIDRNRALRSELDQERSYSARLERSEGHPAAAVVRQKIARIFGRGRHAAGRLAAKIRVKIKK